MKRRHCETTKTTRLGHGPIHDLCPSRSQVPIDIRPWTCKKAISRFKLSDLPVAIFGDSTGWSLPDTLYDIVIEGWLKPTHVEVIQNPKFCAVRAGIAEKRVTVA